MNFPDDIETALTSFAHDNAMDRDEAISRILREWLISQGYLFSGEEGIPPHRLNSSNDG